MHRKAAVQPQVLLRCCNIQKLSLAVSNPVMKLYLLVLTVVVLVLGCSHKQLPADFRPDYGPTVYQTNRPITGEFVSMPLGHTGFRALVSGMRYTDKTDKAPDFCFISVEYGDPGKDNGSTVCFQRQFPVSLVSNSVLSASAKDIISFDAGQRQVVFNLGTTNCAYLLPSTQ